MNVKNKRRTVILGVIIGILLAPLIAMQLTNEVNWTGFDFIIAAALLFSTGLFIDYIYRKTTKKNLRILASVSIIIVLIIVWAELAVGIFGTSLGGS